ncbi:hypothetical protein BDV95DRAFT_563216 [Massariosphaeria phaeospora]|uniref:Uncharacterized protein n=1 Tax=Massariosphaeria phaeospora TaxID=100035 RepID=A0A7C8MGI1_9PLEO|nr:hypothetical protein BDV95DRAFT_563216 [Massariosphaeria phaeospora]
MLAKASDLVLLLVDNDDAVMMGSDVQQDKPSLYCFSSIMVWEISHHFCSVLGPFASIFDFQPVFRTSATSDPMKICRQGGKPSLFMIFSTRSKYTAIILGLCTCQLRCLILDSDRKNSRPRLSMNDLKLYSVRICRMPNQWIASHVIALPRTGVVLDELGDLPIGNIGIGKFCHLQLPDVCCVIGVWKDVQYDWRVRVKDVLVPGVAGGREGVIRPAFQLHIQHQTRWQNTLSQLV